MARAEQAVYAAKRELAVQDRLVRIGQASERQLVDADGKAAAVQAATAARATLMKAGALHAMQGASGKITAWEQVLALQDQVASDLRYLPTMDASRLDHVRSEAKRQKVRLERVLSYTEQQALAQVRERVKVRIGGIHAAEEAAMPLPLELRPVPEALLDEAVDEERF